MTNRSASWPALVAIVVMSMVVGCSSSSRGSGGNGGAKGGAGASGGAGAGGSKGDAGGAGGAGGAAGADAGPVSCGTYSDCPDPTSQVCDPTTETCKPEECPCPSGQTCAYQKQGVEMGACYPSCTPFSTACSGNAECVVQRPDDTQGICIHRGTKSELQLCKGSWVNTDCAAGLVCDKTLSGASICFKQCPIFASDPGCPNGELCTPNSECTATQYDSAAIGSPCSSSAQFLDFCGNDGKAYRGMCADPNSPQETNLQCLTFCRKNAGDCPAGQSCDIGILSSLYVGLCH